VEVIAVDDCDTDWAVQAVAPHLAPAGFVASLQNGINETRIAAIVGSERTVGVGISTIGANATEPGEVVRTSSKGGGKHTVFRAGEIDGRLTPRLDALAAEHCPPNRRRYHCALYDALAAALVLRALCGLEGRSAAPLSQLVRDSVSAPAADDLMQGELGL